MKTVFSDSMIAPRYVDTSSVTYQFPISSLGNETLPTRDRVDGYRSRPIRVASRKFDIVWTMRSASSSEDGVLVVYVWKKPVTYYEKQAGKVPAVQLKAIGQSWLGEILVTPTAVSGTTRHTTVWLDDDVQFIQLYTTKDIAALSVVESSASVPVPITLYYPLATTDILTIEDDFELSNTDQPTYPGE